jgi:UDP-3-O-[3-hydroxymyristoyl] N-acetylglucosamine deacetylase
MTQEKQTTIAQSVTLKGVGLHTGQIATVKLQPASPEQGRYFVRVDLPDRPIIPASVQKVSQTNLSTELEQGEAKVRTVEHLLASLVGLGIDNVAIEIDGPEIPLLDGSAKPWVEAILGVGLTHDGLSVEKQKIEVDKPIFVQEGDAFVAAFPSSEERFTYGIEFNYEAIGKQWYSWNPLIESFVEAIAPARTFGLAEQIEKLRRADLIKGGSLDNALVCSQQGWLNPPLRFSNEPVRHKLLDLLGDLSLLGTIPLAHFVAYKASHKLHIQLANLLTKLKHTK